MDYSRTEIGTGLMIVAAAILAAIVIFVIGDFRNLFTPRIRLEVVFEDSHGIKRYADVRYAGVKVGEVSKIGFTDPGSGQVLLEVEVRRDAKIQEGSRAKIKTLGFLGERYVDIAPPETAGGTLQEGGRIEGQRSLPLEEIPAVLDELMSEIRQTRTQLDDLLGDQDFKEDIKTAVKHAGELTAELKDVLSENRVAIAETLSSTRSATSELDSLFKEHRGDLSSTLESLASLTRKLDGMADDLDALASTSRQLVERNDENIDQTLSDLRVAARNIRQLSSDLKRNPHRLIKIFPNIFKMPGGGDDEDAANESAGAEPDRPGTSEAP